MGFLPAWLAGLTSSRPAMLLLGVEVIGLALFASEPRLHERLFPPGSSRAEFRVLGWMALALAAALLPTLLSG